MLARRVVQLEEEASVEREDKVWGNLVGWSCYRKRADDDDDVGDAALGYSALGTRAHTVEARVNSSDTCFMTNVEPEFFIFSA